MKCIHVSAVCKIFIGQVCEGEKENEESIAHDYEWVNTEHSKLA